MILLEYLECSKLTYEVVKTNSRQENMGYIPPLEGGSDVDPVSKDGTIFVKDMALWPKLLYCVYIKIIYNTENIKIHVFF